MARFRCHDNDEKVLLDRFIEENKVELDEKKGEIDDVIKKLKELD